MTFDNFVYWLDGYMSDKDAPNEIEWKKIKDKIKEVQAHKNKPVTRTISGGMWHPSPDLSTRIMC